MDDGTATHTYDANGREIEKGGVDYTYDWEGRLIGVTLADGTTITYRYDLDGNRIFKSRVQESDVTTTQYVVDDNQAYAQVLLELNGGGEVTARYTYGDDLLSVDRDGAYYYFYDGLGSVRLLIDDEGAVVNRYVYDAYGTKLDGECHGGVVNEYGFTGERIDADTGLVYLRARDYDPTTGRFLTLDSYTGSPSDPLSLHRYAYCQGNPGNCIDPSGHNSFGEINLTTAIQSTMRFVTANWRMILDGALRAYNLYSCMSNINYAFSTDDIAEKVVYTGFAIMDYAAVLSPVPFMRPPQAVGVLAAPAVAVAELIVYDLQIQTATAALNLIKAIASNKPYSNPKQRPPYDPDQVEKVYNKAQQESPDGKVRDPNTQVELPWDKSKPRRGQWDMGHKPGKEYRKLWKRYMDDEITLEEFKREVRDPDNYQPEAPSPNRGRHFEER